MSSGLTNDVCAVCGKPARRFVILERLAAGWRIAWACLFHYCQYYDLDLKAEARLG